MKPRLAFVGNLEDGVDKSAVIDSFDFVVRLNRMNSFGLAGTKTDLLLVDATPAFFNLVDLEEYKRRVEEHVKAVVVNERWPGYRDILPKRLVDTRESIPSIRSFCSDNDSRFVDGCIPTNSFVLLWYLIERGYADRYDVTVFNENPRRFIGITSVQEHCAAAPICLEWYERWVADGTVRFESGIGASCDD